MEQTIPDIETVYGIRPRSVIKSKYFYIISANGGIYRLYPLSKENDKDDEGPDSGEKDDQNEKLVWLYEKLFENNAPICPVVKTLDGEKLTDFEERRYLLTRVPKGRMPDIQNPSDVLEAAAALGAFHKALRDFPTEGGDISQPYQKGLAALKNIKSIINRKNKRNETDKFFLENYTAVFSLAQNAADMLAKCGLSPTYAHGTPKEENFIISGGKNVITNWNCLNKSHFLEDTAYFLKRYFKKADPPKLSKEAVLAAYTAQNPLDDIEREVLNGIMRYPAKYIAVFKEYYGRRRPFAPLYVREKANKELAALGIEKR